MIDALNPKEIVKFFEEQNCFLLSKYLNYRAKLNYVCKCGNFYSQSWRQFKITKGCKDCSKKKINGNKDTDTYKKCCNVYQRLIARTFSSQLNVMVVESMLGYTKEDLYIHIKNFSKFNFKQDWVIDHIFPIKAFTEHGIVGIDYVHIINALENLQPLEEKENSEKGSSYNSEKFYDFLRKYDISPKKYPKTISTQQINDYFGL